MLVSLTFSCMPVSLSSQQVLLRFFHFDLEPSPDCQYDSLAVFSGVSADEQRPLRLLCGDRIPQPVLVDGRAVHIVFSSDVSITGRGFNLQYRVANETFPSNESQLVDGKGQPAFNLLTCTTAHFSFFSSALWETVCASFHQSDCGWKGSCSKLHPLADQLPMAKFPHLWSQHSESELGRHSCALSVSGSSPSVHRPHLEMVSFSRELDSAVDDYTVVAGAHYVYEQGPRMQTRGVAQIIIHDGYEITEGVLLNDIALLRLKMPLALTNYVRPVCLPRSKPADYLMCSASGWGLTLGTV